MSEAQTLEVAKVNKRLVIRDKATGARVYAMPDFLAPIRDRSVLAALAARLDRGDGIDAVVEFEAAHSRPQEPAT